MKLRTSFIGDVFALCKRYIILTVLTLVVVKCGEPASAQALKIGDTVPEAVWNMPLQVINHPEGKTSIALNEYRGKLLILDFWATWCSSCIKGLAKAAVLQQKYGEEVAIIPVSSESPERLRSFIPANKVLAGLQFPYVASDTMLGGVFPHEIVPHLAWISKTGKVLHLTGSAELDSAAIDHLQKGDGPVLAEKKDIMGFDRRETLLKLPEGSIEVLQRSMLTGFVAGIPSYVGRTRAGNTTRYYATNAGIVQLYGLAFGKLLSMPANQLVFEGLDAADYIPPKENVAAWNRKHLYCYENYIPHGATENAAALIAANLNSTLGLQGSIERRRMPCLVVKKKAGGTDAKVMPGGTGQKLSAWVNKVNSIHANQPLINESGAGNTLLPQLPTDNVTEAASLLAACGLALYRETRELEVFVLRKIL